MARRFSLPHLCTANKEQLDAVIALHRQGHPFGDPPLRDGHGRAAPDAGHARSRGMRDQATARRHTFRTHRRFIGGAQRVPAHNGQRARGEAVHRPRVQRHDSCACVWRHAASGPVAHGGRAVAHQRRRQARGGRRRRQAARRRRSRASSSPSCTRPSARSTRRRSSSTAPRRGAARTSARSRRCARRSAGGRARTSSRCRPRMSNCCESHVW